MLKWDTELGFSHTLSHLERINLSYKDFFNLGSYILYFVLDQQEYRDMLFYLNHTTDVTQF